MFITRKQLRTLEARIERLEKETHFRMEPYPLVKGEGEFTLKQVLQIVIRKAGCKLQYDTPYDGGITLEKL